MKIPTILFLASLIASSIEFYNTGYSVQDLTNSTSPQFETDAALWKITPPPCTACNLTYQTDINSCYNQSTLVLGGPQIRNSTASTDLMTFQRTYKNLSTHFSVAFSIKVSYFGSKTTMPSGQSIVSLQFDGQVVPGPFIATSDVCSDSTSPTIMLTNFQGVFAHSSSSLTLTIRTLLPFNRIQFGFREVVLFFYTTALTVPTADAPICQASATKNSFVYNECTCPLGQGLLTTKSTTCLDCTGSNCLTCVQFAGQCYTCKDNFFWDGNSCSSQPACCKNYNSGGICQTCSSGCFNYGNGICQAACDPDVGYYPVQILSTSYCFPKCPDTFPYRYPNGSCLSLCPSPLTNISYSVNNVSLSYCYNPCSENSSYLYPDGKCYSSCASPFKQDIQQDVLYCRGPCPNNASYYSTALATCYSSCPSPLLTTPVQGGLFYCINTCLVPRYLYSNGSCLACPAPLTVGPGIAGSYCTNPCSINNYLYPNGSCYNTCPSPLKSRQEPGVKYCFSPCQQQPSQYLYPNGSCLSNCPAPLTSRSEQIATFCDNPCSVNDYLYPNGSCYNTCPSPLESRQEPGVQYCFSPCQQPSQYLYPNGSCLNSCQSPFTPKSESGVNYCSENCKGYLWLNNTCLSECNSPFKKRVQGTTLIYCDSPCSNPSDYYYPSDGSCQSQCEYPNQITNQNGLLQICTLKITQAQIEQAKALAKTANTANSISSGGVVAGSFFSSGDSTSAAMGSLTKMLSYIKFMKINFPPKLQLLFDSSSSNSSLLSSIPNRLRNKIGNLPPPTNFEKYDVSSSFIINFWPSLIILLTILIVILLSLMLSLFIKRCLVLGDIIQKILSVLKWNAFLTLFCSNCGDVVLFSALEFQTAQFDNIWTALSFTLCIGINFLMGYILFKILEVNLSVRKIQQHNTTTEEEIERNFGDYKALFEAYKENSYLQRIFLFILILRVGLFNGIIGYLYPYPLAQAILIILINAAILAYLLIQRPMKKLINLLQQVLIEGIIFLFNIGVFILAILDEKGQEAIATREKIGNFLIIINTIVPILSMVLIAIKVLLAIWELYQSYRKSKTVPNQKFNNQIVIQQTRAPSSSSYSSQNTSLEFKQKGTLRDPKNHLMTDQTRKNLLRPNFNSSKNNNTSSLSFENLDSSFPLQNINSLQRNLDISYQNSTLTHDQLELSALNLISIEEAHQDFPRNRRIHKRMKRTNFGSQRRVPRARSRPFVDNMISFDPQVNK